MDAGLSQCADHAPYALARLGIEPGRRLIEKEHARRDDERGGDVQLAAHPAGIVLHLFRRRLRQLEGGEQLVGACLGRAAAKTPQPREHHEVFPGGQVFVERGELASHRDRGAHFLWRVDEVVPHYARAARIRPGERGQHAHQRRLACAVRTENGEDHSARDIEIDPIHRTDLAETLGETARADGEHRCVWLRYVVHDRS